MAKDVITVARASKYPLDAFIFIQNGLEFTTRRVYGETVPAADAPGKAASPKKGPEIVIPKSAAAADGKEPEQRVERHVTGRQLCMGLRDFAIEQYGLLARTVLRRWRINSSEDFGHIVFAMVDAGLMGKTDDDTIRDFTDVYDFETAFAPQLELSKKR
ncbi:MAG: hypothetical protein K8S99_15955 [Planctomycetes bacterium]|nr:hypothetical protein [Planctomycetota bacterium]